MAALEQREGQGQHGQGAGGGAVKPKVNPSLAKLDKPDREIAERLERLKAKPQGTV